MAMSGCAWVAARSVRGARGQAAGQSSHAGSGVSGKHMCLRRENLTASGRSLQSKLEGTSSLLEPIGGVLTQGVAIEGGLD